MEGHLSLPLFPGKRVGVGHGNQVHDHLLLSLSVEWSGGDSSSILFSFSVGWSGGDSSFPPGRGKRVGVGHGNLVHDHPLLCLIPSLLLEGDKHGHDHTWHLLWRTRVEVMTLTPTLLFLKRREAYIMASFPHSRSKRDGHGHDHTSHLLWNRRAEIMGTCPPSFSMWEEDDHDLNPPFLKRRETEIMAPLLLCKKGRVAKTTLLTLS